MFSARIACLVALALAVAAELSPAQINVNFNIGRRPPAVAVPPIGWIGGHRPPRRPRSRPPLGVVVDRPLVRPVPPIGSLRPNIYSPAYFRQFPPGFRTILVGNTPFHYYPVLPSGARWVTHRGVGFYRAGGMWFQPHFTGGRRVFLAVPPPF